MGKPSDASNYIYRHGTAPNTRAVVSQKNKIYGYMNGATQPGFHQIGAVSEFGHDESRTIDVVRGIGFGDQVAELVPGVTEPLSVTLNKTLMYHQNLFQTMGYKGGVDGLVRSLKHHRWCFDLKQEIVMSELSSLQDLDGAVGTKQATVQPQGSGYATSNVRALFTFYEGCWFESYNTSFTSDAGMVAENSSIKVTDVIDGISQYGEFPQYDTGLAPISANGSAGRGYSLRFAGTSNSTTTTLL